MQIRGGKPPHSGRLAGVGVELSRTARARLAWMDLWGSTENVALPCRAFRDRAPDLLSLAAGGMIRTI